MGYIGFLLFMIGAAGLDGNNMLAAGITALIGLALLAFTSIKENSSTHIPTKANAKS